MSNLPERPHQSGKSILSIVDDGLLIVIGVIGALVLLKVVGAIAWAVWTFVKIAAIAGLIYVVLRAIRNRGR